MDNKNKRLSWTLRETETLVSEYIERKVNIYLFFLIIVIDHNFFVRKY